MGKNRNRKKKTVPRQSTMVHNETSYEAMVNELRTALEEKNATISEYEQRMKDKEIEYLRSENTALRNLSNTSMASNNFSFSDIESALPVFNREDCYPVTKWVEDFEGISVIFNLSEIQKLIYARRLIGGTAKAAIRAAPDLRCWSDFKNYLLREFAISVNSADVHLKLVERKKKSSESYLDYLFSVYELGKRGNLEDNAIIKYAIKGIQDTEFNKMILYSATNFDEFKEKLKIYASMKENMKGDKVNVQRDKYLRNGNNPLLCFNCGKRGHHSNNCLRKNDGPRCFNCRDYGHKSPNCPKKSSVQENKREVALISEWTRTDDNLNKDVVINGVSIKSFLDTGSDLSFIREDCYKRLNSGEILENPITFQGVGSKNLKTLGCFHAVINIDGYDFNEVFHVVPQNIFPKDCVLGKTLLRQAVVTINPKECLIKPIAPREDQLLCLQISSNSEVDLSHISNKNVAIAVQDLVDNYESKAIKPSPVEMRIILKDDTPIWQNPRRLAPTEKEFVERQMDEWLCDGIIQESSSDFASPIVIVNKKDGSKRICVDYRAINKVIIKDRYPLPLIDDHIDKLQGANVFSTKTDSFTFQFRQNLVNTLLS